METNESKRLLRYAARARGKPTFDVEERDPRQEIAQRLRGMLRAVAEGSILLPPATQTVFLGRFAGRRYDLTIETQNEWLRSWAATDAGSLSEALMAFTDAAKPAAERFAEFSRTAEEADRAGHIDADRGMVMALGSLFNFALEPERLPVIRLGLFERLERVLDAERDAAAPLGDEYEHHVDFARRFEALIRDEGVAVRDMIDTQSLLCAAAQEHQAWQPEPSEPPRRRRPPGSYLAIGAIYHDEAPYLTEWIEFHRLVGVERFFLYNNNSSDEHGRVLAPYVEEGIAVVHDLPRLPLPQKSAYDDCLETHGDESRWIAFVDVDEFLFAPDGESVATVLAEYERWPGVGVNSALYGTSGHRTPPPGLLIENYMDRRKLELGGRFIKSIVDPARTSECKSAHHFSYVDDLAVDENGYPIAGHATKSTSLSRLRINHYWSKSEQEIREKLAFPAADGRFRPWIDFDALKMTYIDSDDRILRWAPALRGALARR
jgi:hypothetical protein